MKARRTIEVFRGLRAALTNDIEKILSEPVAGEHVTGHYAAALLIAVGCEVLGKLQDAEPERAFVERLMRPYGASDRIGRTLFDALRNGVAHLYDTKFVRAGDLSVELAVSWGAADHLSVRTDRDPPWLYLNVRTMWSDFQKALDEVGAELLRNPHLRTWTPWVVKIKGEDGIAEWKRWLTQRGGTLTK